MYLLFNEKSKLLTPPNSYFCSIPQKLYKASSHLNILRSSQTIKFNPIFDFSAISYSVKIYLRLHFLKNMEMEATKSKLSKSR